MDDSDSNHSFETRGEEEWLERLQKIKENDPHTTRLSAENDDDVAYLQNIMTDEEWERLGRDISNNTHLETVALYDGDMNDQRISSLFRGLSRSSSIKNLELYENGFTAAGVQSMVPFLQNANNLTRLDLDDNNIQSSGFNELFRALRNSPIKTLRVNRCNIKAIEIDREHIPRNLTTLHVDGNDINSDGCRQIAKLLHGENATLQTLRLDDNDINDEGAEILVNALKSNASLTHIDFRRNGGISAQGMNSFLRLVNDISSIEATLRSNHTLQFFSIDTVRIDADFERIKSCIDDASRINFKFRNNPDRVGREKIIQTQLNSSKRCDLEDMQGVSSSLYSEVDPLHLPEVLALVGRRHGQGELYVALKSSIAGVISTVNRRECLKHKRAHHEALIAEYLDMVAHHRTEVEKVEAEIAAIDEAAGPDVGSEYRSSKRRRA